jgi:hypothetical protein
MTLPENSSGISITNEKYENDKASRSDVLGTSVARAIGVRGSSDSNYDGSDEEGDDGDQKMAAKEIRTKNSRFQTDTTVGASIFTLTMSTTLETISTVLFTDREATKELDVSSYTQPTVINVATKKPLSGVLQSTSILPQTRVPDFTSALPNSTVLQTANDDTNDGAVELASANPLSIAETKQKPQEKKPSFFHDESDSVSGIFRKWKAEKRTRKAEKVKSQKKGNKKKVRTVSALKRYKEMDSDDSEYETAEENLA